MEGGQFASSGFGRRGGSTGIGNVPGKERDGPPPGVEFPSDDISSKSRLSKAERRVVDVHGRGVERTSIGPYSAR